jgi:hypothetical protein
MSRGLWITLGTTLGIGGVVFLGSRRASAASLSEDTPATELDPLPTANDAAGDLVTNWGDTPVDLRPLLDKMQTVSRIEGSARIFAVIAFRESQFITTAHNGNAEHEQDERDDSRAAYQNNKDRNPPLKYGAQAAEFGSGGLFGALAPYFLWTGVPEVGKKAPLLQSSPELVFRPRAAAFAACVYMQRLLKHYRIDDHADIKAGWASPSLLKNGRGSDQYKKVRARFFEDAINLGIDLLDTSTIPKKLSAAAWPGVPALYKALVGELSKEVA